MFAKMNLRSILVLACTVIAQSLYAQDSSRMRHLVELRFGVNQLRDDNLHAKTSTGTIIEAGYGFERWDLHWQQFETSFGYSRPKTEFEDVSKTANLRLQLRYAYLFRIVNKTTFHYYLGPEGSLAYSACYFPNWDDSHLYWADYLSIGFRNNLAVSLKNEKTWVTTLSLPLFSLYSRPELYRLYKIDDTTIGGIAKSLNSNISPAHLTNTFYVKFNTEIRFPVFRRKVQALAYSLDYLRMRDNDGRAFRQVIHQAGLKFFL